MRGYKIIIIAFLVGAILGISGTYLFFSRDKTSELAERKKEIFEQEKIIINKQLETKKEFENEAIIISESNYIVTISNNVITW